MLLQSSVVEQQRRRLMNGDVLHFLVGKSQFCWFDWHVVLLKTTSSRRIWGERGRAGLSMLRRKLWLVFVTAHVWFVKVYREEVEVGLRPCFYCTEAVGQCGDEELGDISRAADVETMTTGAGRGWMLEDQTQNPEGRLGTEDKQRCCCCYRQTALGSTNMMSHVWEHIINFLTCSSGAHEIQCNMFSISTWTEFPLSGVCVSCH